jgi:hypothetical protein
MPLRIIAVLGQSPEKVAHPSMKQRCHVLHDCELRSYHANGSKIFPPEATTFAGKAGASAFDADCSCNANILARETTADDLGVDPGGVEGGDIIVDWDIRPSLGQHRSGARIILTECDCSHPCPFKAKGKTTDA